MTKRFRRSWMILSLAVAVCGIAMGACVRKESDDGGGDGGSGAEPTGNGGSGAATTNNQGSGLATGTTKTTGTTTTSVAKGGASSGTAVSNGGGATTTKPSTSATAQCNGAPAANVDPSANPDACNGTSIEAEPMPVDMIILQDRSISNSYAVGSNSAQKAAAGQTSRWSVLTEAMRALATAPEAQDLGASITFFSVKGTNSDADNCNAAAYATPVVPLDLLKNNGAAIVKAMEGESPAGLTPTVPALTGVYQYAMAEKKKDGTREKVVVLISDGFPTQCKTDGTNVDGPDKVMNVIKEAASAPIPIHTFIVGVGSPDSLDGAKFNLQNYAASGATGYPPFLLNETGDANAVSNQLTQILLNISNSNLACDYEVSPPNADWTVDKEGVMFTFKPNVGDLQEIPQVADATTCAKSGYGGWYFSQYDGTGIPNKISVCPCTCKLFGSAGRATLVYGCKPNIQYL